MASILRVKDKDGNIIDIPALKGEKGDSYVLTEDDKASIKDAVASEIPVPTKTSELENDSGFITAEDIPASVTETQMQEYVTSAINGSLDEVEAMIDESGVLDE